MTRLFAATFLAAAVAFPVRGEILEQILVKVNGDIITKTEFEQRQVAYLRQTNRANILDDEEALRQALVEIAPQLIVEAVDEVLLVQRGRELGYRLTDEQFNTVVQNIKKENKIETDEQFQAALKQEGMTMADLRRALERQMIVGRVQQAEIFAKVSITTEEERDYYREHPADFTSPTMVTLREILVSVPASTDPVAGPGINVGLDEETRERAEAIRARLVGGEDFATVATQVSDAPSKSTGGLVGPVDLNEMAPALREAVTPLKVGEVSPVLRTARGYHLLKLESSTEAAVQPFEQVQPQIAEKIFEQRRRGEFEKYLRKLRAQAIIEWKNEELKRAYEQRLAATADPSAAL